MAKREESKILASVLTYIRNGKQLSSIIGTLLVFGYAQERFILQREVMPILTFLAGFGLAWAGGLLVSTVVSFVFGIIPFTKIKGIETQHILKVHTEMEERTKRYRNYLRKRLEAGSPPVFSFLPVFTPTVLLCALYYLSFPTTLVFSLAVLVGVLNLFLMPREVRRFMQNSEA